MFEIRSKTRRSLLAYYFANPAARLHLRDLAERLKADPSNLSKELGRVGREGLFLAGVSGRQKHFQLNRRYPLFNEVRRIVAKTIGAEPLIAESLKKTDGIDEAYLYGSYARGGQATASDIDVLVIGAAHGDALAGAATKFEYQLVREINYTVPTAMEFKSRLARKDAFLANIWRNKRVTLIGPDEKTQIPRRRLGANRSLPRGLRMRTR